MRVPISARSLIYSAKSRKTPPGRTRRWLPRYSALICRSTSTWERWSARTRRTLVGSYAKVAAMLDEAATMPGVKGIMLTFDDFLVGMEAYGTRIQPLMRCRQHVTVAA